MKKVIEFISNSLKQGTEESSKRLFGSLGFVIAIIYIGVFDHSLIGALMYTSAGLLGLGILDKLTQK